VDAANVNKEISRIHFNVSLKLSSREVEGNGPMKPGNPPAWSQEGCQFRRNAIREMRGICNKAKTPAFQGFFSYSDRFHKISLVDIKYNE